MKQPFINGCLEFQAIFVWNFLRNSNEILMKFPWSGVVGLSVEPVEEHFHQLPVKEGQTKLQAAVAEEDGEAELYVVKPDSWSSTSTLGIQHQLLVFNINSWYSTSTLGIQPDHISFSDGRNPDLHQ